VEGITDWESLLAALKAPRGWEKVKTIVIDSGTKAEELALAWTLKNIPVKAGTPARNIEDYGFGKGYTHLFNTWLNLLEALDAHATKGRNVIIVCHYCTAMAPNPYGEDWQRYEPRLQAPGSGKSSVRLRTIEWADHVLFMNYDVAVSDDGKGKGGGTRTIYYNETPAAVAKNRMGLTGSDAVKVNDDSIWRKVFSLPAEGSK
jgi:hypothetical protein